MRPENFSPTLGATDPGTGIPGLQRVENYYSTQSFAISQLRCWLLSSPGSYGGIIALVYAISAVFMLITISHVRNKFSPFPSGFQLQAKRRLGRMTKKLRSRSKWSQPINFHFPGKTPPSLSSFQDSSGKRPSCVRVESQRPRPASLGWEKPHWSGQFSFQECPRIVAIQYWTQGAGAATTRWGNAINGSNESRNAVRYRCGPPQEIKLLSLHNTGIGRGVEIKISNAITAKIAILERWKLQLPFFSWKAIQLRTLAQQNIRFPWGVIANIIIVKIYTFPLLGSVKIGGVIWPCCFCFFRFWL